MRKIVILALIVAALAGSVVPALAGGYPVAVVAVESNSTILVLGKFSSDPGQFTLQESEELVNSVKAAVQSILGSTTGTVITLSPSQMAGYNLGDADAVKTLAKNNYKSWGVDIYAYIDIRKTAETAPGYGPNMRMDIHIADIATQLGPPFPAGDLYVASIEMPYMYASLVNSLF